MGRKRKPIHPGDTFHRLTYIKDTRILYQKWYALFQCRCGRQVELRIKPVTTGRQKSCGCLRAEGRYLTIDERLRRKKEYYVTDDLIGLISSPFDFSLSELNR